ncbi:TPA: DsbA family protein [Pseudomonas aeruginosa]
MSATTPTTPENTNWKATIAISALASALTVGAYFYYDTTRAMQSRIDSLQDQLTAVSARGLSPDEINDLVSSMKATVARNSSDEKVPDNWVYGNANARYTLVEMTDTECPYCKAHFPLLKSLVESSAGQINAALLEVPFLGEASRRQANAIECAGEQGGSDAAWKFAQKVFDLTGGEGKGVSQPLVSLAKGMGLDGPRFSACTESRAVANRVSKDLDQVIQLGVSQTPSTLVVDNKTGKSILLQGENANPDGILKAIATISPSKGALGHEQ